MTCVRGLDDWLRHPFWSRRPTRRPGACHIGSPMSHPAAETIDAALPDVVGPTLDVARDKLETAGDLIIDETGDHHGVELDRRHTRRRCHRRCPRHGETADETTAPPTSPSEPTPEPAQETPEPTATEPAPHPRPRSPQWRRRLPSTTRTATRYGPQVPRPSTRATPATVPPCTATTTASPASRGHVGHARPATPTGANPSCSSSLRDGRTISVTVPRTQKLTTPAPLKLATV